MYNHNKLKCHYFLINLGFIDRNFGDPNDHCRSRILLCTSLTDVQCKFSQMLLPIRFFLLRICPKNRRNGKFISLITATFHQQNELPPSHFQRFFASTAVGAWHCANCNHLNWPQQRICKHCTVGSPTEAQKAVLQEVLWLCPNCTTRNSGDHCGHCGLARCTVHNGFWVCSNCMWRNIPVHLSCRKCVRGRPTEEQRQLIQTLRWVCGVCRHHNFTDECFKCAAPKSKGLPNGVGGESLPDGSWYCVSCCFLNFPNYSKCRLCNRGVPTAEQLSAIQSARWVCVDCGYNNYESNLTCYHCYAAKPTEDQNASTSFPHWVCSSCSTRNFPVHLSCRKCVRGRPTEEQRQLIQTLRWVCGVCRHHNFTDECFKCAAPKSKGLPNGVGGESLPDGSWYCVSCWFLNFPNFLLCCQCREGVPTADQLSAIQSARWDCADCGAHNYKTVSTCHKCTAPIPKLFLGSFTAT